MKVIEPAREKTVIMNLTTSLLKQLAKQDLDLDEAVELIVRNPPIKEVFEWVAEQNLSVLLMLEEFETSIALENALEKALALAEQKCREENDEDDSRSW